MLLQDLIKLTQEPVPDLKKLLELSGTESKSADSADLFFNGLKTNTVSVEKLSKEIHNILKSHRGQKTSGGDVYIKAITFFLALSPIIPGCLLISAGIALLESKNTNPKANQGGP